MNPDVVFLDLNPDPSIIIPIPERTTRTNKMSREYIGTLTILPHILSTHSVKQKMIEAN
jgi:hypothetical protein